MGYNWEKIFKEKDEKELISIYSGKSHLDFEASIFAGLELKHRDFDFQKIEKIHIEKIELLKAEIENYQELDFFKSKYFKKLFLNVIVLSGLIFLLIKNKEDVIRNDHEFIRFLIYGSAAFITIITAKWNFNRFKRNKKKTIEKKINLLNIMTKLNN